MQGLNGVPSRFLLAAFTSALIWLLAIVAGKGSLTAAGSPPGATMARQDAQSAQGTANRDTAAAVTSDPQSLEQRGDIYMARKYYTEAADTYRKVLASQPRNAQVHNKLGIAYHQSIDYNNAKKSYRRAIQLNPAYAQAINNLAAVEYAQKHYKAAVQAYLRALKLSPTDAVIYSNLGTAYFALDRFDYATQAYRYALQIDPQIFQHQGRMGTIVQQRDEKNASAFNFYLAKTYADLKDVENTLQYLRKAWEEGYKDIRKALADKVFEFLAAEPRFVELIAQIDAAEARKAQGGG